MFALRSVSYSHAGVSNGHQFRLDIDDVTFPQTGVTAVIGPSGSGKTTLLSLLSGFVRAEIAPGGALTFGGRDMRLTDVHGHVIHDILET